MHERCGVLASAEGLGRIYDCGNCGNIHLQIGMVSLTLSPEAYMQLASMISDGTANFEAWLKRNGPEARREAASSALVH